MDGATRNLLLNISRNGGSLFAGTNARLDTDPVIEGAIEAGFIWLKADGWAAGDYYVMTTKGWQAIGERPPEAAIPEPSRRDFAILVLQVAAIGGALLGAHRLIGWLFGA